MKYLYKLYFFSNIFDSYKIICLTHIKHCDIITYNKTILGGKIAFFTNLL